MERKNIRLTKGEIRFLIECIKSDIRLQDEEGSLSSSTILINDLLERLEECLSNE